MKKTLLYICLAIGLGMTAQADTLLLTTSGTGGTREQRVTLTPSTTLRVSAGGAVEVLSSADFRAAIGLGNAAEKDVGTTAGTIAEGDDARIIAGGTALQPDGDGSALTSMTKSQVGLSNVDNTSDATKDAAVATLTNKTLTSPVINTPTGLVKGDVGLGSADNTSDTNKPVSTAQQTALDLKQPKVDFISSAPATATSTGTTGQLIYAGNYLYICIATDTWLRAQLLTW